MAAIAAAAAAEGAVAAAPETAHQCMRRSLRVPGRRGPQELSKAEILHLLRTGDGSEVELIEIQYWADPENPLAPIVCGEDVYGDALYQIDYTLKQIAKVVRQPRSKDKDGKLVRCRSGHPLYPCGAMRELLVNAIVHRVYNQYTGKVVVRIKPNSIEILVPGNFLTGISSANSASEPTFSLPRNPALAKFMKDMRGIRWGVAMKIFEGPGLGISYARKEIEAAGGTLEYKVAGDPASNTWWVTVVVHAKPMDT